MTSGRLPEAESPPNRSTRVVAALTLYEKGTRPDRADEPRAILREREPGRLPSRCGSWRAVEAILGRPGARRCDASRNPAGVREHEENELRGSPPERANGGGPSSGGARRRGRDCVPRRPAPRFEEPREPRRSGRRASQCRAVQAGLFSFDRAVELDSEKPLSPDSPAEWRRWSSDGLAEAEADFAVAETSPAREDRSTPRSIEAG